MSLNTASPINPALNPGDQLGYYEVRSALAAGGMSLVWKGYDKLLDRHVAIKQIAQAQAIDETLREKFRKEAEIQKKVTAGHKNLVQIIDFVEDPRGLFIVMEYVDGSSLDRQLEKLGGPLPPKQALGLIHQIAVGLAVIHQAGVIHRDLKPSNILLSTEGAVKICDFGLATLQSEQDLMQLGTARYMAPELFTGSSADARADLYSLGMMSYEMLAGRPAFENAFKTVLRDQRNQSLRWMKWHTNQRLVATALKKLNPELPDAIVQLVERMMAKDPAQRIDSAKTLIDVLKRTFSGQPAAAAAGEPAAPQDMAAAPADATAPLPKRSKVPIILAVVLGVQLLGVGIYFGYQKHQENKVAQTVRNDALGEFNRARSLVKDEQDYKAAGAIFAKLAKEWPDDPTLGAGAKARAYICMAQIQISRGEAATADMNFAGAVSVYTEAGQSLDNAQAANGIHPDEIGRIRKGLRDRRSFATIARAVQDKIEAGDFNEAKTQIRYFRDEGNPIGSEVEPLNRLEAQINDRVYRTQLQNIVNRARNLQSEGKYREAAELIKDAQKTFSDSTLREFAAELEQQIDFETTVSAATRLERQGKLLEAIDKYRQANALKPDKQYTQKIIELRSQYFYEQGYAAEQNGDLSRAKDLYIQSDNLNSNKPARDALARIGKAADKQSLVRLGDRLMGELKYDEAARAYGNASKVDASDATVRSKMQNAWLRHYAGRGEAATDRWRRSLDDHALIEADVALGKAKQYDPADRKVAITEVFLGHARRYSDAISDGDADRQRSALGKAINSYIKAKDIATKNNLGAKAVDSADGRLADARYDFWMARTRAAIEAGNWREARASLKAAVSARGRETDETLKLAAEIQQNDKDSE